MNPRSSDKANLGLENFPVSGLAMTSSLNVYLVREQLQSCQPSPSGLAIFRALVTALRTPCYFRVVPSGLLLIETTAVTAV